MMIEAFLKHLRYVKRLSPNTILAYECDLVQLGRFLLDRYSLNDPASADPVMIRSWVVHLVEEGIGPPSVNRKIACLRSFYKFLLSRKAIAKNPMLKINVLKTKKRLPAFVKEGDMVNLLDNHVFGETLEGWRDRLILELFYGTGIRISELLNLREASVDMANRTIRVLGKRNKERVVPFPASLVLIIENYLAVRDREVEKKDHGMLLVRTNGDPCYPMMVYKIVKKYLTLFTSVEKRSPHVLRHTYATHLLNKGADLNAVKDLLGHSSLAATQVYTHNSTEKLKKVFDQAHPKA